MTESNPVPLCHWNATQTNPQPMDSISCLFMPMDCHWVDNVPLCHSIATGTTQVPLDKRLQFRGPRSYSTASSEIPFNRSLASIEASARLKVSELDEVPFPDFIQFSVNLPLQCHSDHCNATQSKFMAKYATPLQLCQSSVTLLLHCHLTTGVSLE